MRGKGIGWRLEKNLRSHALQLRVMMEATQSHCLTQTVFTGVVHDVLPPSSGTSLHMTQN